MLEQLEEEEEKKESGDSSDEFVKIKGPKRGGSKTE